MQFKYYVLNHNFSADKIEYFNIFDNAKVQKLTEYEIKKYLRAPKKYCYCKKYGFEALCERFKIILMSEECRRCEYEIAVGSIFIKEIRDVLKSIENGKITLDNIESELSKLDKRNSKLEKWDCYDQALPNIPMIMRECIYQYKEYRKTLNTNN